MSANNELYVHEQFEKEYETFIPNIPAAFDWFGSV